MDAACEFCHGVYVQRRPSQRFCCRRCLYEWMHEFSSQKKPQETRACKHCGALFVTFCHSAKTYCSMACVHAAQVGTHISSQHKARVSETRKRDWADGVTYTNVQAARTKWYDHVKPNGDKIRLQGTWEVLYAQYMDTNDISYLAHKGAIWYTRSFDKTRRVYLPDFFITHSNEYVDVKNDYLLRIDHQKIEDVRACNPTINLRIVSKNDLINLCLLKG
jgi:hypothetical protein